jgi:exopolysaccharide biosynthesis operon protein EpsL
MRPSDSGFSLPAIRSTGKTFRRRAAIAATLTAATATPLPTWALFSDKLELWGAYNVTDDSNVLRLSKNIDPASVGAAQLDDRIQTVHLGASLNLPIEQQNIQAEYQWFKSKYQYFKDLDFTGHIARAHWGWYATQNLTGTLGYNEQTGLSSFNNIQKRAPDLVTSRTAYATANYMLTPRYKVTGGLNWGEARHSDVERQDNDLDVQSAEVGLAYVTPLDNSFGAVVRVEHGKLPNGLSESGQPFDNEYHQIGGGATVVWIPTPHSRLDARAELVRREYDLNTQRNYTGPILKALYTWAPTPKFTLAAAATRDVGPADDIQTAFIIITGGYVRPRWNITDKFTVQANAEYQVWDYHGDPTNGNYRNRVRLFGASLAFRPTPKILLSAGYNREVRTSDLPTGDYETNVGFVEGRIGF